MLVALQPRTFQSEMVLQFFLGQLAQVFAQDFSGRTFGDRVEKDDAASETLVRRQPSCDKVLDRLRLDARARRHNVGSRVFLHVHCDTDNGGVRNVFGFEKQIFEFRRCDLEPIHLDQFLFTINDIKDAVGLDIAYIAGAQPSVRREGLGGGGRVAPITSEDIGPAHPKLAAFTKADFAAISLDDFGLDIGTEFADTRDARIVEGPPCRSHRGFTLAPSLTNSDRAGGIDGQLRFVLEFFAKRRAADETVLDRRQIIIFHEGRFGEEHGNGWDK